MAGSKKTFWSDPTLEPKRKYRFRMLFNDNSSYTIKTVKNPSVTVSDTEHKFLNHTFYFPGRATWDPIDVTFVDPSAPDQTFKLYSKLQQMGYASPVDNDAATQGFTKYAATVTLGDVRIQTLGPLASGLTDLDILGEWTLNNAFFTKISWGDFSYDDEGLVELSTTIRYDYAEYSGADMILNPQSSNIGAGQQ